MRDVQLGVAGVGLIGGSIALRARTAGARVRGFDHEPRSIVRARERGAIDAGCATLAELAAGSDVLVVALPVDAAVAALLALAPAIAPPLTIDVASVKRPFVAVAQRLPAFVGTHPMAGRERGGIDAADAALFEGATWAHTPHADEALAGRARDFIIAMGARPLEIDPADHDAIVALTSHLPQALSVALGTLLEAAAERDPRVRELCGPGMMSMLRLARSSPAMWEPIVAANGQALAERMRACADLLRVAASALDGGDPAVLMSYFETARRSADAIEERFPVPGRSSPYQRPPVAPAGPPHSAR